MEKYPYLELCNIPTYTVKSLWKCGIYAGWSPLCFYLHDTLKPLMLRLTLVLLNPDMSCPYKQCRSRSVGFWRSQLILICTVCHSVYEFMSTIWIKESDWLKIRSGWGILIYSAWQGLICKQWYPCLALQFASVLVPGWYPDEHISQPKHWCSVASDLSLHCLFRHVFLNTHGKYGV